MTTALTVPRMNSANAYKIAWGAALVFYFLEYVSRSAPAVMLPELSSAFGVDAVGLSAVIGSYYYTYSISSLAAGAALDRFGGKAPVAIGAMILGLGCIVFTLAVPGMGYVGRLLQGMGSAFAFTGAVFLAAHGFSARTLATAVGFTQCFGMLGGSAGQLAVGPLIHTLLDWRGFWIALGIVTFAVAATLFVATPTERPAAAGSRSLIAPFKTVFSNPQSYLCGIVAGLLFTPTTVGDMIWGVAIFQNDRHFSYSEAVFVAAMAPLGWAFGCPLLGWLADQTGRRKLALWIGTAVMLAAILVTVASANPYIAYVGMFMVGVGSGAAMIPYTIIKEVNPDRVKGSAVGVINFITFGVTTAVGPLFARLIGKSLSLSGDQAAHFREAAEFWLATTALAVIVSLFLHETGAHASHKLEAGDGARAQSAE